MDSSLTSMVQSVAETKTDNSGNGVFMCFLTVLGWILGIILLLYIIRLFIQGGSYRKKNHIDGKVVVITGCNTGIGKETAIELAKRGARVYMACRNYEKCEKAREEVMSKTGNHNIFNCTLDLSSLESIRSFVNNFQEIEGRLDILINNAGVMAMPRSTTKDGFEMQMGVNHFGHFYMTMLLLDLLKKSAPSRIVVISSAAYIFAKLRKDDFNCEKHYGKFERYAESKLANLLFMHQLNKKLEGSGVTVNALHPGVVKTELGRHFVPKMLMQLSTPILMFFMKSPKAGAQTSIKVCVDPDLENISGYYFMECSKFPVLSKARNDANALWLWHTSATLLGLE